MAQRLIQHVYRPREIFKNFHQRHQRWAIEVVHRRGGKTVATINDTISRIMYFQPPIGIDGHPMLEPGRFGYVAPFLNQARQIAWDYVKRYTQGMLKRPPSEAELSVTLFNDAKLTLYGADNPDSFRGQYFDGVDLDEYGLMRPSVWSEVILPTLVDRRGWATFIGTPNGPNHFRTLVQNARRDPDRWFLEIHPVSQTQLIPLEELEEMKRLMLEEEYLQEMECSFEAAARGAFYAKETAEAEREGRCRPLTPNRDFPLHFVYDLGYRDDTALIVWQDATDGYPIIHTEASHLRKISYYIERITQICDHYGCPRGYIYLPHDAKAKSLQTGRSIIEQFLLAGIRPRLVPDLDVLDGIAAARLLFPEIYFNCVPERSSGPAYDLTEALKTYRREWDEDKKAFKNKAIEDWSVHYADCFRYFALVAQKLPQTDYEATPYRPPTVNEEILKTHYPITLEDLWRDHDEYARTNSENIR